MDCQIPFALVRNNYLNNIWGYMEKCSITLKISALIAEKNYDNIRN